MHKHGVPHFGCHCAVCKGELDLLGNRAVKPASVQGYTTLPGRQPQRRRFPLKLRYIAVIALCTIAAYQYFSVQRGQLVQLHQKQTRLHTQLVSLHNQQAQLSKQQKQLNDKAYIARYASEHYHLILPGQVPFQLTH
jgi:cell division protein FtsB